MRRIVRGVHVQLAQGGVRYGIESSVASGTPKRSAGHVGAIGQTIGISIRVLRLICVNRVITEPLHSWFDASMIFASRCV